jgi:hypothetical protein
MSQSKSRLSWVLVRRTSQCEHFVEGAKLSNIVFVARLLSVKTGAMPEHGCS